MIIVAKNDSCCAVNCSSNIDRHDDDSHPYQERRQKDMGADDLHYQWDYMEMLCFSGDE